ncbi:FHA domain-containing protein [bacterium]|nr:FHA domain-containing protein [bacterium]
MELRDLVRETRGLAPGTLTRAGVAFLLEEGRLRHETGKHDAFSTRHVPDDGGAALQQELASDLSHRRVYLVERRDRKPGTIGVGRGATNDVRIELSSVSTTHAEIVRSEKNDWKIADKGSLNGTFVEGARIEKGVATPLRSGDVVRFGTEVKLTFLGGESMEHLLRQLDPVMVLSDQVKVEKGERVAIDRATFKLPLPAYLEENTPPPMKSPLAAEPGERTRKTEGDAEQDRPSIPRPAKPEPLAPAVREPPLAVSCPPFPPIGLATGIPVTAGRVAGNDLILPHPHVSKLHACFERHGDGVVVVDLKSANGTFVGGRPVDRAHVALGAEVKIGPYKVRLVPLEAPAPLVTVNEGTRIVAMEAAKKSSPSLARDALSELLRSLETGRYTGALEIELSDSLRGSIEIKEGAVWRASVGPLTGVDALKRLVKDGGARFKPAARTLGGAREIDGSIAKILDTKA